MSQARHVSFGVVVAADAARGIGLDNKLPWKLPTEMAYFKRVTSESSPGRQNAVIMGRKTFESIPGKFRPLKDRLNLVLSRDPAYLAEGAATARSLEDSLRLLATDSGVDKVFVIGGASLYTEALRHPWCTRVYITRVHQTFPCDAFLSEFERDFHLITSDGPKQDGDVSFTFEVYERNR